ncbi:hypothetical protein MMC06_000098 [Schaereria dolodes]|nr:hypothetical protein [Schaereria dolodes]
MASDTASQRKSDPELPVDRAEAATQTKSPLVGDIMETSEETEDKYVNLSPLGNYLNKDGTARSRASVKPGPATDSEFSTPLENLDPTISLFPQLPSGVPTSAPEITPAILAPSQSTPFAEKIAPVGPVNVAPATDTLPQGKKDSRSRGKPSCARGILVPAPESNTAPKSQCAEIVPAATLPSLNAGISSPESTETNCGVPTPVVVNTGPTTVAEDPVPVRSSSESGSWPSSIPTDQLMGKPSIERVKILAGYVREYVEATTGLLLENEYEIIEIYLKETPEGILDVFLTGVFEDAPLQIHSAWLAHHRQCGFDVNTSTPATWAAELASLDASLEEHKARAESRRASRKGKEGSGKSETRRLNRLANQLAQQRPGNEHAVQKWLRETGKHESNTVDDMDSSKVKSSPTGAGLKDRPDVEIESSGDVSVNQFPRSLQESCDELGKASMKLDNLTARVLEIARGNLGSDVCPTLRDITETSARWTCLQSCLTQTLRIRDGRAILPDRR